MQEARLGRALAGKRHSVILATKVGRYKDAASEEFDYTAARVRSSLEQSLRRLRTDYIDVYQAHDIEFAPRERIVEETLPAMHQLKAEGKVRFVGVTAYPLRLLGHIAETAPVDTILSYCRYNLMDTSMDRVLTPLAREKGIGLINGSPLNMRALTAKGAPVWHPAPVEALDLALRAAQRCRRRGVDISELAMQFALQNPYAATTLVGMSKRRHLERNLAAVENPPDPELLAQVIAMLAGTTEEA